MSKRFSQGTQLSIFENKNKESEKGAAIIVVLLISFLLLAASAALLMEVSINAGNITDAVAEQQAYNAAESGIQASLDVLRGNVAPNPLLDNTQSASHPNNKIDFGKAANPEYSNVPSEKKLETRLSRWMKYNYTPSSATIPDRITYGTDADTITYDPQRGYAYSVTVLDPDNPQKIIALQTSGSIGGNGSSKTVGVPIFGPYVNISYNAVTTGNVDVSVREAGINLGSFTFGKGGLPGDVTIPYDKPIPFEIKVNMTAPFVATVVLRGKITGGTITDNSIGDVKIEFDSPAFNLLGSIINLPVASIVPNAPNINGGTTDISVTVTLSNPKRLIIRSTGYGPRGAKKVLEAVVVNDVFEGLIPATVTLVGNVTGAIFKSGTNSSQKVLYSGKDVFSKAKLPPVGTTGGGGGVIGGLLSTILTGLTCPGCTVDGTPADITAELPDYLKSVTKLNRDVEQMRELAISSGRYFSGAQQPLNFGNNANGTGITFVDGDTTLTGAGGGLLVVNGKLTLDGAFDFNGTIIVVGKDGVKRSGSGFGTLQGNLVVAPYNAGNLLGGFLPPKYDITGGGTSDIIYTASNILFGSNKVNAVVVGIAEK